MASASRRAVAASVLLLLAAGAAFHLPRLDAPLGCADTNAGMYFGLFVQTWQDFGFCELRGVPLGAQRLVSPEQGIPYLNHPPGLSWLYALTGVDEWRMRAVTVVAAVAAAVAMLLLLWPRLGRWPALGGALCLLGAPSATLYSQMSYETAVLALGLWTWLATLRTSETTGLARAAWRGVQLAVCFAGPWADWSYGFFCLGLVPVVWSSDLRATVRRLLVPGIVSAAAALSIVLWRAWAVRAPTIDGDKVDTSLDAMLRTTILARPSLSEFVTLAGETMLAVTTVPLAIAGAIGLVMLSRRSWRLALGLLVAGLSQPLVFAGHAVDHVHFYCYTSGMLAAGAAAIAAARGRAAIFGASVMAILAALVWLASSRAVAASDTTFYRDLGATLTAAARDDRGVLCNFPSPYPYYIHTPRVVAGDVTRLVSLPLAEWLDGLRGGLGGFRYLWFRRAAGESADSYFGKTEDVLEQFLAPFPRTRVPELEQRLHVPALRLDLDIQEVYLVEVPPR